MTQDEFEKLRTRLEEQLRLDVEMLYEAHRVKLRAFETIRQARAELAGSERLPASGTEERRPPAPPLPAARPAPAPPAARKREAWSVLDEIVDALGRLPDEFDKHELVRALGRPPSRATLARALGELCKEDVLAIFQQGFGRFPARFRKRPRAAVLAAGVAEEEEREGGAPA